MHSRNNIHEIEQISLVDFLARLGHQPVKKSGKEHLYHSMLRDTARNTPSLAVWDSGGKWMDHGGPNATGIYGGGIIQLAQAYWPNLHFKEVLERISETMNLIVPLRSDIQKTEKNTNDRPGTDYAFALVDTRPIGTNPALTKYLNSRGVFQLAKTALSEIYYRNIHAPEQLKPFYAVGWKNQHDNWEFADAKGFKSSIGAKGISVIAADPAHVALFEGYMDYLSWRTLAPPENMPTVIVLNSVVQLPKAIEQIKDAARIDLYFDNDAAGRTATRLLQESAPRAQDKSGLYSGYKDYNEYLMSGLKETGRDQDPGLSR